ncbi:MAG: protein kinase [Acidobacteriota bacterium]
METKNISPGRLTQAVDSMGTAPIVPQPSLKQTGYDGELLKNRYLIEGELGRGGIGVVYLARDTQLMNRRVVIKVLLEDAGNAMHNPWFKKKFEQEIEALIRLDHPGIVGVLDVGTMPDGKEFFVMQYVEGHSLRKLVTGQMDFGQVARIVRQIGQALTSAHDKGIVHRDLKPENIMVNQTADGDDEIIKLIDFGIATVKDSQVATNAEKTKVAGALPYMAPEQLRGQPEASSDIWALGAMAYEMLTGRLPFYAETLVNLYEVQKHGVQVKPRSLRSDIPASAEDVIIKSLAFDPAQRYLRAKDLGDQLARALTNVDSFSTNAMTGASVPTGSTPSPVTSESPGYGTMQTHSARTEVAHDVVPPVTIEAPPKSSTRKFPIAAAIGLCALVAIAAAIWFAMSGTPPATPPVAAPSRQLSYSLRVLQNPAKNPGKPPLSFPGEIIFAPGDELCLNFNSPQAGYLYIINEGPQPKNGLPVYNLMFPDPTRIAMGAPSLKASQQLVVPSEQPPWFNIDAEVGTEILWLIWSEQPVNELEATRKWFNPTDKGEINDAGETRAIQQFIDKRYAETKPKVEKDELQTNLKGGKDGLLIYRLPLAHT